jgi:oxaloacetate decarboxylase alpha subunit
LKQSNAMDKYEEVLKEVPRVRQDFGYPPLVTPTSQIVGTQAVLNVVTGERYKMVPKESKGVVKGEYGKTPAEIPAEITKKILGDEAPITCRPADLIEPELEKIKAQIKDYIEQDEDVLSYALLPQVAEKFFQWRIEQRKPKNVTTNENSNNEISGEIMAVISAAVAEMNVTPGHSLEIKSVNQIGSSAWSLAGRLDRLRGKL